MGLLTTICCSCAVYQGKRNTEKDVYKFNKTKNQNPGDTQSLKAFSCHHVLVIITAHDLFAIAKSNVDVIFNAHHVNFRLQVS